MLRREDSLQYYLETFQLYTEKLTSCNFVFECTFFLFSTVYLGCVRWYVLWAVGRLKGREKRVGERKKATWDDCKRHNRTLFCWRDKKKKRKRKLLLFQRENLWPTVVVINSPYLLRKHFLQFKVYKTKTISAAFSISTWLSLLKQTAPMKTNQISTSLFITFY